MRFLHTADWHLGRLFHQVHLTDDQAFVLRQVLDIARDARVDAIVIAGDVYDRAVPPPEAVELLDDTLSELLLGLRVPTILAAGNHDSPERLSFGARLLAHQGLHLFGAPSRDLAPVVLEDAHGPVAFYVAPYSEPALVRDRLSAPDVVDHESGMRALVSSLVGAHPRPGRSVFVGHAYVHGAVNSDSERPLSVGGAGAVEAANFDGFQYVALGHLHRPQEVGDVHLRYAGALLKYSFDEVGQQRSVTIVEMDGEGACRTQEIPLVPRRDLRRIEGTLDDLLHPEARPGQRCGSASALPDDGTGPEASSRQPEIASRQPEAASREAQAASRQPPCDDYVVARLLDRHPVLDPIGRLRAVYPNVLCIERPASLGLGAGTAIVGDRRQLDYGELFATFFRDVTGGAPTPDEQALFASIVASMAGKDREVQA